MKTSQKRLRVEDSRPQAWIAIHKNRQKTYKDGSEETIYLKDGQEFQIELYNPTQSPVLAKIRLNGNYISDRGLILDPGQRWFLDRHIDSDKRLMFDTYEVENTETNAKAIVKNGMVVVEFYPEIAKTSTNWGGITWTTPSYYDGTSTPGIYYTNTLGNYTTPIGNSISGSLTTSNASAFYNCSLDASNTIETGRVKEGAKSDQTFVEGSGNFSSFYSWSDSIKVLPISRKPMTSDELRSYCHECGTRVKKQSWKFCPNCGSKF